MHFISSIPQLNTCKNLSNFIRYCEAEEALPTFGFVNTEDVCGASARRPEHLAAQPGVRVQALEHQRRVGRHDNI
jgi:hypothetical protein